MTYNEVYRYSDIEWFISMHSDTIVTYNDSLRCIMVLSETQKYIKILSGT